MCRARGEAGVRTDEILDISDLVSDEVELLRECLDLRFRPAVDIKVEFAAKAVFGVLAVLAHHDHGRLDSSEHG